MASQITSSHLPCAPERGADLTKPAGMHVDSSGPMRLLAAGEVAQLLGVPRSFVYALARRRAIPTVRLGDRYIRFRPAAIQAWITDREQSPRSWS